jgi:hypothetical protein
VVYGRLAVSTFSKEEDGIKKQITKPVIKLTSFHLCGKKPQDEADTADAPKSKLAASKA